MDAGPYDNVEFPIRPGTQNWSGPQTSTKLYGYNVSNRERVTGTPTLAPVAESDGNEFNEFNGENPEVEEQRQLLNITSPPGIQSPTLMMQTSSPGCQTPSPGVQTTPPGFHIPPMVMGQTDNFDKKVSKQKKVTFWPKINTHVLLKCFLFGGGERGGGFQSHNNIEYSLPNIKY